MSILIYKVFPEEYDHDEYDSEGLGSVTLVQVFSIHGKTVYLLLKRRRWRHKEKGNQLLKSLGYGYKPVVCS